MRANYPVDPASLFMDHRWVITFPGYPQFKFLAVDCQVKDDEVETQTLNAMGHPILVPTQRSAGRLTVSCWDTNKFVLKDLDDTLKNDLVHKRHQTVTLALHYLDFHKNPIRVEYFSIKWQGIAQYILRQTEQATFTQFTLNLPFFNKRKGEVVPLNLK